VRITEQAKTKAFKKMNNSKDIETTKLSQIQPYLKNMDLLFQELFIQFTEGPFLDIESLPCVPGIYVFYKAQKPIYVGRTDNIKKRIAGHTRPSSNHSSANFAFNLAKLELDEKLRESKLGRQELINNVDFFERFSNYKIELSASKLKCIEITNDIVQTMFEPYLALKLGTYPNNNSFENH